MRFTQEQIDKKLKEIQAGIPKEWLEFEEKPKTPTIEFIMNKALESETISEEKKEQVRRLIRLGLFNKKRSVLVDEKRKKIDDYLNKEIKKAIRKNELPPPKHSPLVRKLNKQYGK